MSEQVKRVEFELAELGKVYVLASDFDALEQRCRELEAENGKLSAECDQWARDFCELRKERDTLRATITAARDKLGPAVRNGHPALTELAASEALALLEAAL